MAEIIFLIKIPDYCSASVVYAYNPSTPEAEARKLRVPS
jgi:hypothetical protein